jgi:hypothetical protein
MRTIVYVDGLNLYYGCLKGTPFKWLDLAALCSRLLPGHDIRAIKYFTTRVDNRMGDSHKSTRQDTYFRALRTLPSIQIILGQFLTHPVHLPKADGTGYRHPSRQLLTHADFVKQVRRGVLAVSQLPDPVLDSRGSIQKPSSW